MTEWKENVKCRKSRTEDSTSRMNKKRPGKPRCFCCIRNTPKIGPRLCPLCSHVFKGTGWDGVDTHWRRRHEKAISYDAFWLSLCPEHRAARAPATTPAAEAPQRTTGNMPIWQAVVESLRRYGNGQAMRITEVCVIATKEGWLKLNSKTPDNSVRAIVSLEKKRKTPRFVSSQGRVALTQEALRSATAFHARLPLFAQSAPVYEPANADTTSIISVLEEHFQNGFRLDSEIEIERFRRFYSARQKGILTLTNRALHNLISSMGIKHAGKVFLLSHAGKHRVECLLTQAFTGGADTVFYDAFFDRHADELSECRIYSAEMLRDVLPHVDTTLHFRRDFFARDATVHPEDEIARCFTREGTLLNQSQIAARLPYIPPAKIRSVLYQKQGFISISRSGRYAHLNQVHITDHDRHKALTFVSERLREASYVSARELDVSEILDRHPEIPAVAAREVLCRESIDGHYARNGNIIAPSNKPLTVRDIIARYCRDREEVTFEEINELERALCERTHSTCLVVAYDEMIRVRKEIFVADHRVHFDTPRIDALLEVVCPGNYIPLQAVRSFSHFPYPGYAWTSFLLESFARRFSRVFRFDALAPNSVSAGAIIRQNAGFAEYREVLSDAAAKADCELTEPGVVGFLCDQGYLGRNALGDSEAILTGARVRREGGS